MKISELSNRTGASARSIRHYEQKNLITSRRLENGYRDFDEATIDDIKTVQLYLGLGLTTDQIEAIMNCKNNNPKPEMDNLCVELLETYEKKLEEINHQMETLGIVKERLENQVNRFKERIDQHEKVEINHV